MAWTVEDRRRRVEVAGGPYLTEELKTRLRETYFPRYPTKRAVLLPALHAVQHRYNWIPPGAMEEVAEFLGLAPAEVMDTATFYEEYWLRPKGKYLVQVCRSLSCGIGGQRELTDRLRKLNGWIKADNGVYPNSFIPVQLDVEGNFPAFQGIFTGKLDAKGSAKVYQDVITKWRKANAGVVQNWKSWASGS